MPQQLILSYRETLLCISVMGDPITGFALIEYVKIFFGKCSWLPWREVAHTLLEQDGLPYAEGWRPITKQTNLLTLGGMILALNAANGEIIPEGVEITTNTLKRRSEVTAPSWACWPMYYEKRRSTIDGSGAGMKTL